MSPKAVTVFTTNGEGSFLGAPMKWHRKDGVVTIRSRSALAFVYSGGKAKLDEENIVSAEFDDSCHLYLVRDGSKVARMILESKT